MVPLDIIYVVIYLFLTQETGPYINNFQLSNIIEAYIV